MILDFGAKCANRIFLARGTGKMKGGLIADDI